MTRAAIWLLAAGVLLFAGVLVSQGLTAVFATLAVAGWGLPLVALIHLVPLALDAASIRVMFDTTRVRSSLRDSVLARWIGESANSFLPAGPIGGPVMMVRYLAQRGMSMREAAAGVTVSTTLQTLAQIIFALIGMALLGAHASQGAEHAVANPVAHRRRRAGILPFRFLLHAAPGAVRQGYARAAPVRREARLVADHGSRRCHRFGRAGDVLTQWACRRQLLSRASSAGWSVRPRCMSSCCCCASRSVGAMR